MRMWEEIVSGADQCEFVVGHTTFACDRMRMDAAVVVQDFQDMRGMNGKS